MRLEDVLKESGWTDQDLAGVATMLADPRFRESLEKKYGLLETERDQLKERDAAWQRQLDEQWQPRVSDTEKKLTEARLELAQAQERLKIAKEFGYIDDAKAAEMEARVAQQKVDAANTFDPKKFVSYDDLPKLVEAEAEAIAMVADLNNEYMHLNGGKTLYDYETEINGVPMRGVRALRQEAKAKRSADLGQFIREKFDFKGKHDAIKQARQKEHDDAIRKEAEDKVNREWAERTGNNPNLLTFKPSRSPFFQKQEGGKQPWEIPAQERQARRIERAVQEQLKSRVG